MKFLQNLKRETGFSGVGSEGSLLWTTSVRQFPTLPMRCMFLLLLFFAASGAIRAENTPALVRILLETEQGAIELELDAQRAPISTANFLTYVSAGLYDGGVFHRTVKPDNQPNNKIKIEVIQAGIDPARSKLDKKPIALERTRDTGLKHVDAAVSMARSGPDTATSDFFICIGDQPELDFGGQRNPDGQGFAAFGHVVRGMEVVRKIQQSPADAQSLKPPIRIIHARRL
jgi:peptidyl-prolyl cis-trans isomerase A (cyclophilin A)